MGYYVDYDVQSPQISSGNTSKAPQPRQKKPVVQDIYDEDHYCLARSSGFGPHDNVTLAKEYDTSKDDDTQSEKTKNSLCTKNRMIFGAVACVFILCGIGGIVAFIHLNKQVTF